MDNLEPHVTPTSTTVGRYLDTDGDGQPDTLPEVEDPGRLVSIPPLARTVLTEQGRPLNRALAGTGRLHMLFGVLFALGLWLGAL